MKQILFYCGQSYSKHTEKKEVKQLTDIDVINTEKDKLPWIQVFNSVYRITNETLDWSLWTGCVILDIDSKHYYEEIKKFKTDELLKGLYDYLLFNYYTNFYCIQKSNSGTGYHVFFYFNVEKSYDNYQKCQYWATKVIEEAFISLGAKDIIYYKKVIDNCTKSPVQGIYITKNELLFGDINSQWFGNFDVKSVELEYKVINNPKYINEDGTNNFIIEGQRKISKTKKRYEHRQRMAIYMSLISILKEKEIVDKTFTEIVNERFEEYKPHNLKFFIKEPQKNSWFSQYNKYKDTFVRPWLLEEVGYNVVQKFNPEIYSPYVPDKTYKINSNQYLGDIDIQFKRDKINHIFAGCGFGKTTWAKKLGKFKRVCVISPLTSINKDAFSEENGWLVIDNNNKQIVKHIFNNIGNALTSTWNICTTWESFSLYEMYKYNFDYIIIDEIHTLYMYDYRINSIRHLKEDFPRASGIKIIMTGTPSFELNDFDCYKIQIIKEQPKTKAEFLFYNDSSTGWIYKDIKDWTKDDSHVAIIFKDQANYKDVDNMMFEGIDCDIFNSNYKENVEYILDENNIRNNVTIFSVYGQAGINLYIDLDKKVRLYILNKNGLGIIQYANRVRNKETIDKIIIPFKKSQISNTIERLDTYIDIHEAIKRVEVLNMTIRKHSIFEIKTKSILLLKYGFVPECLDRMNDEYTLNVKNYIIYKMIKNIDSYEKQIQIIYNRLIENDFDVQYNYLFKDEKTNKSTKMRSNQLAGNIVNFDFSQIEYDINGNIYIKPNDKLLKVSTGNLIEILTNIFNYIKRSGGNIEEVYNEAIRTIVKRKDTVTKKDLENLSSYYWLKENWEKFYNNAFIVAMDYSEWDIMKLTASFMRSVYNEKMTDYDLENLTDEAYIKLKNLKNVYANFVTDTDKIKMQESYEKLDVPCDDITMKIYNYLLSIHTRGKNGKKIMINGVIYDTVANAVQSLHKTKKTIYRWLKICKAKYI